MHLRDLQLVPQRKGSWLVTLPLVGIALAYLVTWFVPTRKAIAELEVALSAAENVMASYGETAAQLEPVERQLAQTNAYLDHWNDRLIHETEFPNAFATVSDAATAAGVETARFAPKPPEQVEQLSRVVVDMQVVGTFGQIGDFLSRLEQLPLVSWIERVTIATNGQNGEKLDCGLSIVLFAGREEVSG